MDAIASQITSLSIVYSTVYSDADKKTHQSSASLAFVWGIHRRPVNSPHKWPVTRKMFPFDDVIMIYRLQFCYNDVDAKNDQQKISMIYMCSATPSSNKLWYHWTIPKATASDWGFLYALGMYFGLYFFGTICFLRSEVRLASRTIYLW